MLKLFLLRHGKAEKYTNSAADFHRKLSEDGNKQVNQIGNILAKKSIIIDQIISSGALRTRETTLIMNQYLHVEDVLYDDELFLASKDKIAQRIAKNGKGKNLLYIGHNFGISEIVGYLTGHSTMLSTSSCVEIDFDLSSWAEISRETGILKEIYTPDIISF